MMPLFPQIFNYLEKYDVRFDGVVRNGNTITQKMYTCHKNFV